MRAIPRRTATSIPSLGSRRLGRGASAHRKHVRLAKLAFERQYQVAHLAQARERAKECLSRLAEIDKEQADLLASIDAARKGYAGPSGFPRRARTAALGRPGGRVVS